jgi:hypothetical protein
MSVYSIYTDIDEYNHWVLALTDKYDIFFYNGPYDRPLVAWASYRQDMDIRVCCELNRLIMHKFSLSQLKL